MGVRDNLLEMLRKHRRLHLLTAIEGDDAAKMSYAVRRVTERLTIGYAVYGTVIYDNEATARRVLHIFNRLKRLH